MKSMFLKIWKGIFPDKTEEYDVMFVPYHQADTMMKENKEWTLSKREDNNRVFGMVWICKIKK